MKVNIELVDEKCGIDSEVHIDIDLSSHSMDELMNEIRTKIDRAITEARSKADDEHIDKDFENMRDVLTAAGVNMPIWVYNSSSSS